MHAKQGASASYVSHIHASHILYSAEFSSATQYKKKSFNSMYVRMLAIQWAYIRSVGGEHSFHNRSLKSPGLVPPYVKQSFQS